MALPLADESGLSRNCAEAAGLPPATVKSTKSLTWQVNCLGTGQQAQSLYDDDDDGGGKVSFIEAQIWIWCLCGS
jgi:hypothetical protein